jgi:hypothetical protein
MNDTQIDHLIAARNRITDRVDEFIDSRAVDHIDAVLSDIPEGQRNDVDGLLGRACYVLPERADYALTTAAQLAQAADEVGVTAEWLTPRQVAWLETMTAEQSGIVEHDDASAGMWK